MNKPVLVAVSASTLSHERAQILEAGFDDFISKPVQEGRLFSCMAKYLDVEYLYREEVMSSLNLEAVKLPNSLCDQLRQAVELGQVTELDRLVEKVRALGEDAGPFADDLEQLCRRLNLEGIQMLLEDVQQEG